MSEDPQNDPKMILLAAGGTGGHMFPARAFADALKARGFKVGLVTDPRGRRYCEGFPADALLILPVSNADAGGIIAKFKAAATIGKSLVQVMPFLRQHRPAAIVGFGGYPTFPVLQAAGNIPIFIHEQNAILGRVNRLFQKRANIVASGFARLDGLDANIIHEAVGNPVRADVVAARATPYPTEEENGTLRLLVTGGSQGARLFGDVVPSAIAQLPASLRSRLFVSQQVREEQCEDARKIYADAGVEAEVWPFFKDMAGRLAKAHLVIGRSGASTVSETAVVGRPAIFVPLAVATHDHQTINALALADNGAADVIAEQDFNAAALSALLAMRLNDPAKRAKMAAAAYDMGKPEAAETLVDMITKALDSQSGSN